MHQTFYCLENTNDLFCTYYLSVNNKTSTAAITLTIILPSIKRQLIRQGFLTVQVTRERITLNTTFEYIFSLPLSE